MIAMVIVPFKDGSQCELNEINHAFCVEIPASFFHFSIKQIISPSINPFNFLSKDHKYFTKLDLIGDKIVISNEKSHIK